MIIYELLRYVRTGQLGHGTPRRPEIIDDFGVYKWEWLETLWSWHFDHPQTRRQVKNWVSHTGRPWQKTLRLYSSRPPPTPTKWIDRSAVSSILYLICHQVVFVDCHTCHPIPWYLSNDSYNLRFLSIVGPSPSPRPYRRQATFSEPFRWTVVHFKFLGTPFYFLYLNL